MPNGLVLYRCTFNPLFAFVARDFNPKCSFTKSMVNLVHSSPHRTGICQASCAASLPATVALYAMVANRSFVGGMASF